MTTPQERMTGMPALVWVHGLSAPLAPIIGKPPGSEPDALLARVALRDVMRRHPGGDKHLERAVADAFALGFRCRAALDAGGRR